MTVGFPLLAQELERAFRQGHVAVVIAFAAADVQEPALGVNVANLQAQTFAQAQAAGIEGGQAHAMVEGGHSRQDAAHLRGRQDDGQFELGIGPSQLQFVGPGTFEGFLPEDFEGADDLGAGLAGDLLVGFKMDALLAKLLGGDPLRRLVVKLAELTQAGVIGLLGARPDRQKFEIIGEGF